MKKERDKKDKLEFKELKLEEPDLKLDNKKLKVKWDPLMSEYEEDLEEER